jgi:cysteine synthase A
MLPDTGERYLSTPLFEHIRIDMSADELEISRSTPSCRFEAPAPTPAACRIDRPAPTPTATTAPVSAEIEAFLDEVLADPQQPVVLFALEWCEFCWAVRKLFARHGIAYRAVDLDSVPYQKDDRGGRVRAALRARIGSPTIPQVFVGGQHIGGCSETFDAFRSGQLQQRLQQLGVAFEAASGDPSELLPGWLHPRVGA